jgi:DNA polymerase-3 subunit alpha
MKYVSLHSHSTYSYADGYALPEDHVKRVADLDMSALALTEHGNVSSHVKLEQAAKEHGIKSIFGLEAYTAPANMRETQNQRKWHLTILAADDLGYRNLMQLVTKSWDANFYRWPTVLGADLREHHEGLIVLSGCADSKLACDLLGGKGREKGDERDAVNTMLGFKRLLGDRFYLEVQQFPELDRTRLINEKYEEWSSTYGIPLVASSDVHYPHPENNEMQKILHAAGRNTGTVAAAEAEWEYDIRLTYPTSDNQIKKRLRDTGLSKFAAEAAIAHSAEIAERCNVELPKMDRVKYPIQDDIAYTPGMTTEKLFRMWMNDGWKYRGFDKLPLSVQKQYKERAEYEYGLMADKDFLDYFMMMSDAVRACKDNGIPVGPARGSAAASLVCYLLRITEVDPMKYPLMLFERFIAPDRHDLPDVDLDFDDDLRDGVRLHMAKKYGEDRVGNIGTFTRYRGKNSIDDVARVYRIPKWEVDAVKGFIPERTSADERFDASISDMIEMYPKIKEAFERWPDLYRSIELEGNLKNHGVHAAGVVVGAEPLWNYVATYSRKMQDGRKLQVLSVDKYDGEHLGLLKLDALGLKTMGMIRIALEIIGMSLDELYALPTDDPDVLDAFNRADVTGIFQFEGRTMRLVTQELRPNTFMDLSAINALARPGPYNSGTTGDYILVRHGRQEREDLHSIVGRICEETEGQIIYQEQIIRICSDVGNFPWTHATKIRKIISQKYGEAAFEKMWGDFRDGAATHDIDEQLARKIWNRMITAGLYAFNVAHSISYSLIGYWSMWLKVHHPLAFYAAQLQKTDDDDKKLDLMRDMMDKRFDRSYEVLPPNPKTSGRTWQPLDNGVLAGFKEIPGIGDKTSQAIVDFKEKVEVERWDGLIGVPGIGKKTIEKMREFSLKDDPFDIHKIERETKAIREWLRREGLPMPNTLATDIPFEAQRSSHIVLGLLKDKQPQDMYENVRARTGEELDPKTVKDPELSAYMTMFLEDTHGRITLKVNRWTYPKYRDDIDNAIINQDYVLAKAVKKPYHGRSIHATRLYIINPDD